MVLNNLKYPSGAEFAFTILDDTDDTTVENGRPVYDLLSSLGIRTTKTVWAFDAPPENRGPYFAAETLSSPDYFRWVSKLAHEGFEIAFHNATMGSSVREDTIRALDLIEEGFNQPIRLHCNHGQNRENLYWGVERYNSFLLKQLINLFSKIRPYPVFEGDKVGSPYYWADVAAERLSYIRAFAFRQLNCMSIPPGKLFRDAEKQPAPLFFNTADAADINAFNKLVNPATIDRLRGQKGWAIVSTHLGKGFYWEGELNPKFRRTMEYMTSLPGWFVPAGSILDFIKAEVGVSNLSCFQRSQMECSHVIDRIQGRLFNDPFY